MSGDVHVRICERLGVQLPRATRLVVLCRKDVATPLRILRQILERLELQLNEGKTRIVDANKEGFSFLGFALKMNVSPTGVRYPHINPGEAAVVKVKSRIKEITTRNRTGIPINDVVRDMNRTLRGWSGYFHYRNSSAAFLKVKRHAEERLRIHLRKRHKVTDWNAAMIRFPKRVLYAKYGLYKLSTVAGWKTAHASR
jgi:hypothetical protein